MLFTHRVSIVRHHSFPTHPDFWKNIKNSRRKLSLIFFEKSKIPKIGIFENLEYFGNFRKSRFFENLNFENFDFWKIFKLNFLREFLIFFQKSGCVGKLWWRTIDIWWENIIPVHWWWPERPNDRLPALTKNCPALARIWQACQNMTSRCQNMTNPLPKTVFCIHQKNEKLYFHVCEKSSV